MCYVPYAYYKWKPSYKHFIHDGYFQCGMLPSMDNTKVKAHSKKYHVLVGSDDYNVLIATGVPN